MFNFWFKKKRGNLKQQNTSGEESSGVRHQNYKRWQSFTLLILLPWDSIFFVN